MSQIKLLTEEKGSLPTYPETVPDGPSADGRYEHRDADFWTCGFFPGSIYALLERAVRFPAHLPVPAWYKPHVYNDLLKCGRKWSLALHEMSSRTDTHDMGFIIQPALRKDWELTGNSNSLKSVQNAAYALASRYDPRVGAIRSWDEMINYRDAIVNQEENFLVIVDSMCNLDLLFYVGHLLEDQTLVNVARSHADKVRAVLVREDFSTFHVANLDQKKGGAIKSRMTNQGWKDQSTWSRGQAWAIMGFAQTYMWTQDEAYLDTSLQCARLFLDRLNTSKHHHKWVPNWDFDAPQSDPMNPLRDTSAGVIAANGMLLLHQALQTWQGHDPSRQPVLVPGHKDFLDAALSIVRDTMDLSLDLDFASVDLPPSPDSTEANSAGLFATVRSSRFDAILHNATANNNEHAHKRYSDHGLVYADYYLLEFGNKLCRMGFC